MILTDEQRAFAASLHDLLSATAPGPEVWQRLAKVGVFTLALEAEPIDAVVAFEELGHHAVDGPVIETVVASTLLPLDDRVATLAAPPLVPYALDADTADLVFLLHDNQLHRALVREVKESVDSGRRLFEVGAAEVVAHGVDGPAALDLGALLCAAQLLGLGRALLRFAVEHAQQRVQFGRAIGSFQAVKHKLADVHIGLEFARPLLHHAAATMVPRDVSAAKVACADAAQRAARAALQVHGAIGYTRELRMSRWLTKVIALQAAWGSRSHHRARVWESL